MEQPCLSSLLHLILLFSRIGPTPGLSLLPQNSHNSTNLASNRVDPVRGRPADAVAATLPSRSQQDGGYITPQAAPSALNTAPQPSTTRTTPDEFGNVQRTASQGSGNTSQHQVTGSAPAATATSTTRRTTSTGGTTPFTVANPRDSSNDPRRNPSTNGPSTTTPTNNNSNAPGWSRAEDEKVQLYEKARARAERIQGVIVTNVCVFCCCSSIE